MEFNGVKINWPLSCNQIRRGLNNHTFGMVRKDATGKPKAHQGWDLQAIPGTPVFSVSKGKVAFAGDRGALGLLLVISIENTGYYAAYAHLSQISVKVGDELNLGDIVGNTGNTGNANTMKGPDQHLHFEVRDRPITGLGLSNRISPLKLFKVCPYEPIIRE